jgi:hypothetical protein
MMMEHERRQRLAILADALARRRLTMPARIALDMLTPLGFLASQVALFAQPFTPRGRWHDYVTLLSDQESWSVLRDIVEKRDS